MRKQIKSFDDELSFFSSLDKKSLLPYRNEFLEYGITVIDHPLRAQEYVKLHREAAKQKESSWRTTSEKSITKQSNLRSQLSGTSLNLISSHETLWFLEFITGKKLLPSFESSCFTYYTTGDFLDKHCDRDSSCSITVLIYLDTQHRDTASEGLMLKIFPNMKEKSPSLKIFSKAQRMVVLLGSEIPHARPVLENGESVTLLALCFKHAN